MIVRIIEQNEDGSIQYCDCDPNLPKCDNCEEVDECGCGRINDCNDETGCND